MIIIPKRIIQNKLNKLHNISDKHLEEYLASLQYRDISTNQALEECLRLTSGACEDVPIDNFDPLEVPIRGENGFNYSNLEDLGEKFGEEYYQKIINNEH
jgi:hypothetical protein